MKDYSSLRRPFINTWGSNICGCSKSSRPSELRVEASGAQALICALFQSRIARPLWFVSTMVLENVHVKAFLHSFWGAVCLEKADLNVGQEVLVQLVQLGHLWFCGIGFELDLMQATMLGVGAVEIEPLDENETDAMNMESPRVELI